MTVGIPAQGAGQQQWQGAILGRINNAFFAINDIQTAVLGVSGSPPDRTSPTAWISALGAYLTLPIITVENRMRALQFCWLRKQLDAAHRALFQHAPQPPQRRLNREMTWIEGHISQWYNYCRTGEIDPATSPEDLPTLWGLENGGMLWIRAATPWVTPLQIAWMAEALNTSPPMMYFANGQDTLMMSYWSIQFIYWHLTLEVGVDEVTAQRMRDLCVRLAFLIDNSGARGHVPNLANPPGGMAFVPGWVNFPNFQRNYSSRLGLSDENDELKTVSGLGTLAVTHAGLLRPSDWKRLCLRLGLNPPRVIFPSDPTYLLQAYRSFFCLYDDQNLPHSLIPGMLRNLVARFEFIIAIATINPVATANGKVFFDCRIDWEKSTRPFYFPLINERTFYDGDTSIAPAELDPLIVEHMRESAFTVSTHLSPNYPRHFLWHGVHLLPVQCIRCTNILNAMQLFYSQNHGRPFEWRNVPSQKIQALLTTFNFDGVGAVERMLTAVNGDGILPGITFAFTLRILLGLCGPVCLADAASCVLGLEDLRALNLDVVTQQNSNPISFIPEKLRPWEALWNSYKTAGLVNENFPQIVGKHYPSVDALLQSAEMGALKRCITILLYLSKVPIIYVCEDCVMFGLPIANGIRSVLPGLYLPPDPEILARTVAQKLRNVPRQHATREAARDFFKCLLEGVPELDTAAICAIADGFFNNDEWTRTPENTWAYLQGYFDGQYC
jgi:hypothetical protein